MSFLREYTAGDFYIRHAVDDAPAAADFGFHVHDQCEIFYFVAGDAEYLVEGARYPLRNGSLMMMSPTEAHCVRILGRARYERYALNFPLSAFDSFDPKRLLMRPYCARELGRRNLLQIGGLEPHFAEMCREDLDNDTRRVVMYTKLAVLLDCINRAFDTHTEPELQPDSIGTQIVSFVNQHLFDELNLDAVAAHFYLSRSQLGRVFRKTTGAPPWDYITAKRLVAAKALIANGSTARAAAEQCGFRDYSVFYRAFVKRFGCSPSSKAASRQTK